MPPILSRTYKAVRRPSIVAVLLVVAAPQSSVSPDLTRKASLQEVKRLAWFNNWLEASEVAARLEGSGFKPKDEAEAHFLKAVRIRGNIEGSSLPHATDEIASMLATDAARQDFQLRLQLLAIQGDIEFQFSLPASQEAWKEVKELASTHGKSLWEARAEGELGMIAFLKGASVTAM